MNVSNRRSDEILTTSVLILSVFFFSASFAPRKDPKTRKVTRAPISTVSEPTSSTGAAVPKGVSASPAAAPVSAAAPQISEPVIKGPGHKLGRGFRNVFSGPFEVAKYMILEAEHAKWDYMGSFFGVFYGSFKGAGLGAARMGSGLFDILTFPVPFPPDYESIIQPERFTFEETEA